MSGYSNYKGPILGKYLQEHLPDNFPHWIIYCSNLDVHCIVIGMDDEKLRKILSMIGKGLQQPTPPVIVYVLKLTSHAHVAGCLIKQGKKSMGPHFRNY